MADTVVDFINTTKTFTDFQAGVTLVSNSASEQAVVKDIELSNPNGQTFAYNVGNVTVATSNATKLSGTELIGSSRSLVMGLSGNPVANYLYSANNVNNIYTNPFPTFFDTNVPSVINSDSGATLSISPQLNNSPYFICFGANGDFYYGNSNSSQLSRRAGGINGTETTVIPGGQAGSLSFDGRYIYGFWVNTNGMTTYDTLTNTTVTSGAITGAPIAFTITNQSSSACLDGYVMLKFDGSTGNYMFLINGLTRAVTGSLSPSAGSSQRFNMAMGKNSIGQYYVVRGDGGSAPNNFLRVTGLGSNLASPSFTQATFTNPTGWYIGDNLNGNAYLRNPSAPRFIISAAGNSPTGYIDLDSFIGNTFGAIGSITVNNLVASSNYGMTLVLDTTKASADFGTIGVRATGIKTT